MPHANRDSLQGLTMARLVSETARLRQAAVYRAAAADFLTPDDVNLVFRALAAADTNHQMLRTYVDGARDSALGAAILAAPPRPRQDYGDWLVAKRAGRLCVVLNKIDRYCPELVDRFAGLVAALLESVGAPAGDIAIAAFIGNYGYTPFGAHHDPGVAADLQFHVGPNAKTMLVWSRAEFLAATGGYQPFEDVDRIAATGKSYALEPGDLFVLNPGGYHVARADAMSATFSIVFREVGREALLLRALAAMKTDRLTAPSPAVVDFVAPADIDSADSALAESAGEMLRFGQLSQVEFNRLAVQCYLKCRATNLGFATRPRPRLGRPVAAGSAVRRTAHYRLDHAALPEGALWVFCRGHRLLVPDHPRIAAALDVLNGPLAVPVDLVVSLLAPEWPEAQARMFLTHLCAYGGLAAA